MNRQLLSCRDSGSSLSLPGHHPPPFCTDNGSSLSHQEYVDRHQALSLQDCPIQLKNFIFGGRQVSQLYACTRQSVLPTPIDGDGDLAGSSFLPAGKQYERFSPHHTSVRNSCL